MSRETYTQDFCAWTQRQAALLREGRASEADLGLIAQEIESMGRGEQRELVSRLDVLLTDLLKWHYQPARRTRSWSLTILEQRRQIERHLSDNPSLRPLLDTAIEDSYGDALIAAQRETDLDADAFPAQCPIALEAVFTATYGA